MNQSLINSAFLAYVQLLDKEDTRTVETLLQRLSDTSMCEWAEAGYKYIAPLAHADSDGLARERPWIDAIIRAVNDSHNGVREQVAEGIKTWELEVKSTRASLCIPALAEAVAEYLEKSISAHDLDLFQSLELPDDSGDYFPINRKGRWSFGVVNPWPGGMSAEAEVLSRMKVGADDAGLRMTMLSNFGHVLKPDTQKQTKEYVDAQELDFVISTHYDTHKSIDAFYYHTLWNPPEIPLNLEDYAGRVTDNYLMNDDYLIYDSGGMSRHLECILMNKRRNLSGATSLTASFPRKSVLRPKLDDPKMFYCGMNWERVVSHSNRHEGLFKLLDQTGKVKFFGPDKVEAWGGIRPWEGYRCYQHSIPFDGFSILKEINDCGICLVLSSDIHRRAGSATNRTYEACAAGAVIISDDNPFMLKYFHDAALFIQYNKNDPEDTFRQLMEKYEWVTEHKEEALRLAERAQQIFLERFTVDRQLSQIVKQHPIRLACVKDALFAHDEKETVLATYVLNTQDQDEAERLLQPVLDNIGRQYYRNIRLAIAADDALAEKVREFSKRSLYATEVVALPLFDFKNSRQMTDAEAEDRLYRLFPHRYFINMRSEEVWFRDHVTTLVRAIEDSGAAFAYSGRLFEDKDGYRRTDMFAKLSPATIYAMNCPNWMPMPGQILFSGECHASLPPQMLPFLDGMEHYALMNLLTFREKRMSTFTCRMTYNYLDGKFDKRCSVLPEEMQGRLIRDSVKYDLPEGGLGSTRISSGEVMRIISLIPVKHWLSMRLMRIALRIIPSHGLLYKRLNERYEEKLNAWLRYFP